MAVSMTLTMASTEAEKKLLELCSKDVEGFHGDELAELLRTPGLQIEATDENGMSGLLHAVYKGNSEACRMLLESGADVNSNLHVDRYTALMFATIAGHVGVVELVLQAGARTTTVNNVGKTAAQLGAFVGQHACVRVINNFFSINDLEYFTIPQGVEKVAKLDPSLAAPLHKLMTTTNLHPVKVIQYLQAHPSLLEQQSQVRQVLDIISDKTKEERETYSLKMHYLAFVIRQCYLSEGGPLALLKILLTYQEDGLATELDKFMRQCLREFPHIHSVLLKQMVATLAKVPPGCPPTALSIFHHAILGNKSEEEKDSCSTCGEYRTSLKKCSRCKQAWYCSLDCQKLHWTVGNHKKLCKKWAEKLEPATATTTKKDGP